MGPTIAPTIRETTLSDLAEVLRLVAESGLPTAGIRDHFTGFLVADVEGRIVGGAGLERYGNVALLRSVAVDPAWQGMGLGRRLTDALLERCRHPTCEAVYLLTETAGPYFARFGFRTVARELLPAALGASEELRGACPDSAVCMQLTLPADP